LGKQLLSSGILGWTEGRMTERPRLGEALACSCGGETHVIRSSADGHSKSIIRRRECRDCGRRFTTREVEVDPLTVSRTHNPALIVKMLTKNSEDLRRIAATINEVYGDGSH
jgi:hypothetical protein